MGCGCRGPPYLTAEHTAHVVWFGVSEYVTHTTELALAIFTLIFFTYALNTLAHLLYIWGL